MQKPDCAGREKRLKQIVVDFCGTYRIGNRRRSFATTEVLLIIFFLSRAYITNEVFWMISGIIFLIAFIDSISLTILSSRYNKLKVLFVIIINSTIEMINGRSNQMITFFPQFRDTKTSKPKILFVGGLFVSTTILLNYYSSSLAQIYRLLQRIIRIHGWTTGLSQPCV